MEEKPKTQLSEQQEKLVQQLKIMDEMSAIMAERLKPIRCSMPKPASDERKLNAVEQTLSPAADFLRCAAKHAESINARMRDVMEEIAC